MRHSAIASTVLLALNCHICTPTRAAAIYVAHAADGTPYYATSALDPSFQLLQADETPRATPPRAAQPGAATGMAALTARKQAFLAQWLPTLRQLAQKYGIEPALVIAVIEIESGYNPHATSRRGASGLMQLMPDVAARYGVKQGSDIAQHLEAGIHYLSDLKKLHPDNLVLVLAAYNAGQRTVLKYGQRLPPYKETLLYVPQVLAQMQLLRSQGGVNANDSANDSAANQPIK